MITDPKSKRNVSMPDFLCEELKDYIGRLYGVLPTDRIFHLTKSFLHHEMTRGAGKAGVKRIRIHDLRHSRISLLISKGFSVVYREQGRASTAQQCRVYRICASLVEEEKEEKSKLCYYKKHWWQSDKFKANVQIVQ